MVKYKNGNYYVSIDKTGTKKRMTVETDTVLKPIFPESIDMKITNKCDLNCKYCHEESVITGKHSDINSKSSVLFLSSLKEGMEIAVGGGNPLEHPDLEELLTRLKEKKVIANMTVNQRHLNESIVRIKGLMKRGLINAIGVSVSETGLTRQAATELIDLEKHGQVVLHSIYGINTLTDPEFKLFKTLILGYKIKGRGASYVNTEVVKKQSETYKNLEGILEGCRLISMDNLAIKQLEPYRILGEEYEKEHYMGDDGQYTMYVDLVEEEFSTSSINNMVGKLDERSVEDIFKEVKRW